METVTLREYDYLTIGEPNSRVAKGKRNAVGVPERAFTYLEKLLEQEESKNDSDEHGLFMKRCGKSLFQVQSYVGVLQTPCGTQIEILPKISDSSKEGDEKSRKALMRMLRYLKDANFKLGGDANLKTAPMHLLELFMSYFLQEVNRLVKRGVRSDYVTREENQVFLKGKLLINQQIQRNTVQQQRFFCAYDEYEPNRPENRLIHSALQKVSRLSRNANNQRLSRELMFVFADVPISKNIRQDFLKCKSNRAMVHYQHPLEWCRLILNEESTVSSAGNTKTISILFPMERIFEDYVAAMLRKSLGKKGYSVRTQESRKHLCVSPNKFQMKPDIVIRNGDECWVADTKWKVIDERESKHGVSQSDMYQLYAYGKKYKADGCQMVFLIYPKSDYFTKEKEYIFEENDETNEKLSLQCLPFDCEVKEQDMHIDMGGYLQKVRNTIKNVN